MAAANSNVKHGVRLASTRNTLCCDSVEWCPDNKYLGYVVVGHYELQAKTQSKIGGISIYNWHKDNKTEKHQLNLINTIDSAPVLDLKWTFLSDNKKSNCILSCANANGKICLYTIDKLKDKNSIHDNYAHANNFVKNEMKNDESLNSLSNINGDDKQFSLSMIDSINIDDKSICLSLDWSNLYQNNNNIINNCNSCVTSLSNGEIAYFNYNNNNNNNNNNKKHNNKDNENDIIINKWKGHNDQVWTVSFDHYNPNIIYSGSDDYQSYFAKWDIRQKNEIKTNILNSNSMLQYETHDAGVCSIIDSPNNNKSNYILTGSYDECLRLWDKRNMTKTIDKMKFNDGVWRVKWNTNALLDNYILVGAMRDNFHIIKLTDNDTLQRVTLYDKHTTDFVSKQQNEKDEIDILAYGCDWKRESNLQQKEKEKESNVKSDETQRDIVVGTCSFYDKQFHIWSSDP